MKFLAFAAISTVTNLSSFVSADFPEYYVNISKNAKDGQLLKELQDLCTIPNEKKQTYAEVWEGFKKTGKLLPNYATQNCAADEIADIYSNKCWKAPAQQCGTYKAEGQCYNREHSFPASWFGITKEMLKPERQTVSDGAYSDLHHIYPSDGFVNSKRGNIPLGYVDKARKTYESTNGSVIGPCKSFPAAAEECFEVADELKGDLARSYFYLSMLYRGKWTAGGDRTGVKGAYLKEWMEKDLRQWHLKDPVDKVEEKRNETIYKEFQGNRNPFVDRPAYLTKIASFGEPPKAVKRRNTV